MSYRFRKGLHWRNVNNVRLRRLAEAKAYECDKWMEDAEEEHDGTVDVVFGSTGATLTLRLINSEATGLFGWGHCALLAYSLHKKTNLPFIVFDSPESVEGNWTGHAGILLPTGEVLDIYGIRSTNDIQKQYGIKTDGVILSESDFVNKLVSEDYRDNPFDYLEELEQLVLDDFTDFILEENKKDLPLL